MTTSYQGHSDVVNRLLECKQIDVNLQDKVSGIFCSPEVFQPCLQIVFLQCIVIFGVNGHVEWIHCIVLGFTKGEFRCGQSVVGVQTN